MATLKHWAILIALAAVWGSSFILIKRGLFSADGAILFSPVQLGALRITIAAAFLAPFAFRQKALLKSGKFWFFLIVGLCGNAIPAFLFAKAQTEIPSALAGMLNSMVPIFSMLIAVFIFSVRVNHMQIAGIITGLCASVLLLLSSGGLQGQPVNLPYALLVVLATLCYAISLNVIKQYLQNEPAIGITSVALLVVSPIGIVTLGYTGLYTTLVTVPGAWYALGAVAVLAIFGTAIALILFNQLVQDTNTLFASSVTYLIPLVAILWGLADGERFKLVQGLCAAAMIAGIVMINRK